MAARGGLSEKLYIVDTSSQALPHGSPFYDPYVTPIYIYNFELCKDKFGIHCNSKVILNSNKYQSMKKN